VRQNPFFDDAKQLPVVRMPAGAAARGDGDVTLPFVSRAGVAVAAGGRAVDTAAIAAAVSANEWKGVMAATLS
jgi:hypothetical protein